MGSPGYQLSAAMEGLLHNLRRGPQRLTVQNIDSLFALVIGLRTWRWTFTWPEFRMSHSTTYLSDVDSKPGTNQGHCERHRRQGENSFLAI
jgi:hypothetical protein